LSENLQKRDGKVFGIQTNAGREEPKFWKFCDLMPHVVDVEIKQKPSLFKIFV
jgi:hypothetical protein